MRYIEDDGAIQEKIIATFGSENPSQINARSITFPGLEIFLNQHRVYRNGKLIPMTSHEFHTLVYLAQHPDWVCKADSIYENVWQKSSDRCGTAVANVICHLRHKLTPDTPKAGYIQTVIGDGYKFVVPK